ncbi:MAG: NAD(P)H-dependent oxidoreductase subunit E [Planctomycetes bacterium]|nr:NAD(P)H-dependent oxidoreductase subunit E [Planctomycetota bacterium]
MDLKHLEDTPTDAERQAVDDVVGQSRSDGGHALAPDARARRSLLLPALLALQARRGWVSRGGLGYVCRVLEVPPAEAFGVASFYALLALAERPAAFAHLCDDVACSMAGADQLRAAMEQRFGAPHAPEHRAEVHTRGHATKACWAKSPCLGLCDQAPAALVTVAGSSPSAQAFGGATAEKVAAAMAGRAIEPASYAICANGPRRLLARAGLVDPTRIDLYQAHGGFEALHKALAMGPAAVIAAVTDSKLAGRGGAAFPTGKKWEAVSKAAATPRYVVCNADESEPGTFKDRVLLEEDPFAVLEAMTIAGFAVGAARGYLYLRGEYPKAASRIAGAIQQMRAAGFLGSQVAGSGFAFDIELRSGAGAYICGEETALFASIEGYRGEPRSKPPFPVHSGLFAKPTAINNVETLAAVLHIVREGAASYASAGTAGSPGTKLFCVSGRVANPGVYETPFGTPLRSLLEMAGGVPGGRPIQAVLLGGAAGGFVSPAGLDLELSFEGARSAGATLGSGVILVLDDTIPLVPMLRRIAEFFRDESCGQCVPCRVGTVRQEELLARLESGVTRGGVEAEGLLLADLGQAMRDASICGLGQTASSAIESALRVLQPFPRSTR